MNIPLLLLEDDPAIANTVVYALSREGFAVEHVSLVSEARVRLLEGDAPYAAAIFDVGLPDGNGLDLCRSLRQQGGALAALPIVMLTARSEELDRVLGLELGADDYLTKPFSPRELCARVRALLRRAALGAPSGGAPVAVQDEAAPAGHAQQPGAASGAAAALQGVSAARPPSLVCDTDGQRIFFGAATLPLTRRELGLLTLLLKQPGRIWPRDALLDAVWGLDADSTDRTVDTHIKTLRAKLREAGAQPDLIVTHRGLGYAIDPALL
jgi:two-component system catabolic regulation response regulator CreB